MVDGHWIHRRTVLLHLSGFSAPGDDDEDEDDEDDIVDGEEEEEEEEEDDMIECEPPDYGD